MDVLAVNECDVLCHVVITLQNLNKVLLDFRRLLDDMLVGICNAVLKEPLPFCIGELILVQLLQPLSEVCNQFLLGMNREIGVSLLTEQPDEFFLQRSFRLVAFGTGFDRLIFRHHGILVCLCDYVEIRHSRPPPVYSRRTYPSMTLKVSSLSR